MDSTQISNRHTESLHKKHFSLQDDTQPKKIVKAIYGRIKGRRFSEK